MAVGFEVYTSIDAIADEWDALADRAGVSPFLRPGWHRAWWEAFGSGRLEVCAWREKGALAAAVPVVRRAGGLHVPVNWHTPEFGATAADSDAARALYGAVLGSRPPYASIRFVDESESSLTDALRAHGYAIQARTLQESPYLPLSGGWDALPKSRERDYARLRRRLAERGEVTLDVRDGSEDLDALLEEGFAIEGSGWKTEEGTAILSRPDTTLFYREMALWAASSGFLRLFFLRCGGRATAFELGLIDGGRYFFVKGGYDPEFRKQATGLLLMRDIIHWCCVEQLDTFEFLGAPDAQKLDWTSLVRRRMAVEAFAGGARGFTARAVFGARPLLRRALATVRRG